MFTSEVHARVKEVVAERKTTQASLLNELVKFALDNADLNALDLEPAKPRGRKKKVEAAANES